MTKKKLFQRESDEVTIKHAEELYDKLKHKGEAVDVFGLESVVNFNHLLIPFFIKLNTEGRFYKSMPFKEIDGCRFASAHDNVVLAQELFPNSTIMFGFREIDLSWVCHSWIRIKGKHFEITPSYEKFGYHYGIPLDKFDYIDWRISLDVGEKRFSKKLIDFVQAHRSQKSKRDALYLDYLYENGQIDVLASINP